MGAVVLSILSINLSGSFGHKKEVVGRILVHRSLLYRGNFKGVFRQKSSWWIGVREINGVEAVKQQSLADG